MENWRKHILSEQGQTPEEKALRRQRREATAEKKYEVLYHIAKAPAQPEVKPGGRRRPWLKEPQEGSHLFMSTDWRSVAYNHGVPGNVYKYEIPHKLFQELREKYYKQPGKQPIHRFDLATELLIPGDIWEKYRHEIQGPEFVMDDQELGDFLTKMGKFAEWEVDTLRHREPGHEISGLVKKWANASEESIKLLSPEDQQKLYMRLLDEKEKLKNTIQELEKMKGLAKYRYGDPSRFYDLEAFLMTDKKTMLELEKVLRWIDKYM